MDKIKHRVVQSAAPFSDMMAGILKEVREENGQYGYSDVVNACGLSYARLHSEIEERYENGDEQYDKADGKPLHLCLLFHFVCLSFPASQNNRKSADKLSDGGKPKSEAMSFEYSGGG